MTCFFYINTFCEGLLLKGVNNFAFLLEMATVLFIVEDTDVSAEHKLLHYFLHWKIYFTGKNQYIV